MNEGDIAIAPLPQVDGRIKNRPVVLLRRVPPFDDWLTCGVSSKIQHQVAGFDELIEPGDSDFKESGLKVTSLIRLGFLAVLPESAFLGAIGSISAARHRHLLANLCRHLSP